MKYIFEIKIKSGHSLDEYVESWKAGSAVIQKYPGANGTRLYKKIGEPEKLLAIADWESKKLRDQAMKSLSESDSETQKIWKAHGEYGDITKIGEFDETGWEVISG